MPSSRWNKLHPLINELLAITSQEDSPNLNVMLENYFKVNEILNEVQKIEPEFDEQESLETRLASFKALIDWVELNGGSTENIAIDNFGDMGFGVKAKVNLSEGQLICAVPYHLIFTVTNAQESLKNLVTNDPILKNMNNVALAVLLIMEYVKGSKSFWWPYIQALPRKYMTVLYFNTNDLLKLKGSPAFESGLKICKSIARQYAYFKKIFETSEDEGSRILRRSFSYQLYRWGVSTIMTRQNSVPHHHEKIENALIPLWDMCNHANGRITTGYNDETNRCECLAPNYFAKDEQVFIFYGARSNAEFLLHNGFVYPENEHDTYRLHLGLSQGDVLFDLKSSLLNRLNIKTKTDFFLRKGAKRLDEDLVAFLRIFNMEKEHLEQWLHSTEVHALKAKDCSLEDNVDKRVSDYLATRIKLLLRNYTDIMQESIKEDESAYLRLIRLLKSLEKNLLLDTMKYIENHA